MHGYDNIQEGIVDESNEEKGPFLHEIADTLPSVMINRQAGNSRSSPSGGNLDNLGGGPRRIMDPSTSRPLSHHGDQRHPPRNKSPHLLPPEDLPEGGAGTSMPDQFRTRQAQESNPQEYSAPPVAPAAGVRILVSPPQLLFPQPPWGSTTVDPRTLPSNHVPIPAGTQVVLPYHRNTGTKRKYRVDYKCFSMTQEKAHRYIENLSKTGVWILPLADTPPSTRLRADQAPYHQRR
jgi:hypothetical protein